MELCNLEAVVESACGQRQAKALGAAIVAFPKVSHAQFCKLMAPLANATLDQQQLSDLWIHSSGLYCSAGEKDWY